MAVKAVRAGLASNPGACSFDWWSPNGDAPEQYMRLFEGGYRFSYPHKLGYGMVHMAILAKMPALMHSPEEETVWQHLERTTTTPMKREWMKWIIPSLLAAHKIYEPSLQHGLRMSLCEADDETLDKLVTHAVSHGKVKV